MNSKNIFRLKIIICIVLVCLSWGSCYLFIELALKSFPTFSLTAMRLGGAGLLLFSLMWILGKRNLPTKADILHAFFIAFFMSFISAGIQTVGQETVPSGTVAMIMGSTPLWMVLSGWIFLKERRPSVKQFFGLFLGLICIAALGFKQGESGGGSLFGIACLFFSIWGWTAGSLISKKITHTTKLDILQYTGLILMAGSIESLLFGLFLGEEIHFGQATTLSLISLFILIIFGGATAYASYFWLLKNTPTPIAISYEYVNPIIGVILGRLVTGESITLFKIIVCIGIIISLFFVISEHHRD